MSRGKPGPKPRPIEERFWSKVEMGMDCWVWTGAATNAGYGLLGRGAGVRSNVLAHRLSWEIHFGAILPRLEVCHHCDNPRCVNPAHLFVGTHKENFADASRKGRMSRGESHYKSKFKEADVIEIRRRGAAGETEESIADLFDVSRTAIHKVLARKNWKHLK
jgi:hypothetical protein